MLGFQQSYRSFERATAKIKQTTAQMLICQRSVSVVVVSMPYRQVSTKTLSLSEMDGAKLVMIIVSASEIESVRTLTRLALAAKSSVSSVVVPRGWRRASRNWQSYLGGPT
jgi:hypothetical protein